MTARRDPLGIATATVLCIIALVCLVLTIAWGSWWALLLLVAFPAAILGATGLVLSIPRVERDASGNRVER